jgi:hypothetical protein
MNQGCYSEIKHPDTCVLVRLQSNTVQMCCPCGNLAHCLGKLGCCATALFVVPVVASGSILCGLLSGGMVFQGGKGKGSKTGRLAAAGLAGGC